MCTSTGEVTDFKGMCIEARVKIKDLAEHIKKQKEITINGDCNLESSDKGEMIANLTLAYRHLEDASMRMGKAIQAFDGGISIYDKDSPERDLNKEA